MPADLFLALDVDSKQKALQLAEQTSEFVSGFKLGPRLLMKYGPEILQNLAKHKPVFVDNKYFDIPNTMLSSIRATFEAGASFATIHASAGPEALSQLAKLEAELNQQRPFKILAVTVLTSFSPQTLPVTQVKDCIKSQVLSLAKQAYECGIKNFVCSAKEVNSLRQAIPGSYLVTPGIRFKDEALEDQKRVVEPSEAVEQGASAVVVGRPIVTAANPRLAAEKYFKALT